MAYAFRKAGSLTARRSCNNTTWRMAPFALCRRPISWYDPREREFYTRAVAERHRLWTDPYTFYPDFGTGITRTEAIFDEDRQLHAVVTADYEIGELSGVLAANADASAPMLVFTPDGVVLATSARDASFLPKEPAKDRPLQVRDLLYPPLHDFFEHRGQAQPGGVRTFSSGGKTFVAIERVLDLGSGLRWHLATLLEEDTLVVAARAQARAGVLASALVSLVGASLAAMIAIGINRLRAQWTRAEERAGVAIEHARELGSYRLTKLLGTGGMGEVYRARHRMLAREAAIKLIRTDVPGVDRAVLEARFEREATVLARLRSPHTVSVLDYGRTTDGRLFLVMELLEGLPLDRLVTTYGPQPVARVVPMLVGVCRSLSEAHAAGLVHRDIKPANIFLCYDGDGVERVKVLDFGLAKVPRVTSLTVEGAIAGTPDYMSPEQARGAELDARSDLYSLGCTAFFLLSGRTVFQESNALGTVLAHQITAPPSLSESASQSIPAELERLVSSCLQKAPEARPSSAAGLAQALAQVPIPAERGVSAEFIRAWWDRANTSQEAPPATAPAPSAPLAPSSEVPPLAPLPSPWSKQSTVPPASIPAASGPVPSGPVPSGPVPSRPVPPPSSHTSTRHALSGTSDAAITAPPEAIRPPRGTRNGAA